MLEQRIIAMAVLFALSHPELTESSSNCFLHKEPNKQIKRVDVNATAHLSCPALAEDEKLHSISLHKGDIKLHPKDQRNDTDQSIQRFQLFTLNSSFSFTISRTEVNDTGLYNCTVHTGREKRTSQTILIIAAAHQPTELPQTSDCHQTILFTVGGIIIAYSLFITVFFCFIAYKLKNKEPPENTYMNTRPRIKRCGGAQHPANITSIFH